MDDDTFEKRARDAAMNHAHRLGRFGVWIDDIFVAGARWANADREAYAEKRVAEERERIFTELKRTIEGTQWASWLSGCPKADAGKEK